MLGSGYMTNSTGIDTLWSHICLFNPAVRSELRQVHVNDSDVCACYVKESDLQHLQVYFQLS